MDCQGKQNSRCEEGRRLKAEGRSQDAARQLLTSHHSGLSTQHLKHGTRRWLALAVAAVGAFGLTRPTAAAVYYWDVNGTAAGFSTVVGAWDGSSSFWNTDSTGGAGGGVTNTTASTMDLIIPQATTNTGSITVTGTQSASSITFATNVGPTTNITGGTAIVIGGTGTYSGIIQQSTGANTISTALTLNSAVTAFNFSNTSTGLLTIGAVTGAASSGTQTVTVGSSGSGGITLSGIIGDGASGGNVALTINNTSTGITTLSATNTFTGRLTVQNGTVSIPVFNNWYTNGPLGNSYGLSVLLGSVGNTGTIEYTGGGTGTNSSKPFTMAAGGSGGFQIDTNTTTVTLSGQIDGSGGLTKTGAGTLVLTQGNAANGTATLNNYGVGYVNQFTGTTVVSNGRLQIQAYGAGGAQVTQVGMALQKSVYDTTGSNGSTIGLDLTNSAAGTPTFPWLGGLAGNVNLASAIIGYSNLTQMNLNPQAGVSASYGGIIAQPTAGLAAGFLNKIGPGTQIFTGANTYSGATTIYTGTLSLAGVSGSLLNSAVTVKGGTLLLDNSSGWTNRIADTGAVSALGLGSLALTSYSGAGIQSETVGATTFGTSGKVTINNGGTTGDQTTLALGAVTRSAGAAIDFVGTGLGTLGSGASSPNVTSTGAFPGTSNGILPWATVNETSWATNSSNSIVAYAGTFVDPTSAASDSTKNAQFTGTGTIGSAKSFNSLNVISSAAGQNLNLSASAGDLTLTSGAILKSGTNAYTISSSGSPTLGKVTAGSELIAQVDGGALTISAPLNTAIVNIAKGGTGALILSGTRAATLSGSVSIAGTLEFDGLATTLSGVVSGPGNLTVNLNAGQIFTLNNTANSFSGNILVEGGVFSGLQAYNQSGLSLAPGTNVGSGATAAGGLNNIELNGGIIAWSYTFARSLGNGPDQFKITGGTSGFTTNAGNSGHDFMIGASSSGNTEVQWGSTYFNPSTLVLQDTSTLAGGQLSFRNALDLNGAARTVAVNATVASGAYATISGNIRTSNGTAGLTKTGVGLLQLSGTNTYNGPTTVSAGILEPMAATALPGYNSSGNVVFSGGTLGLLVGGSGWTTAQGDTLLSNATKTSGALGIDTTNANLTQWTAFTTTNFGSTLGLTKFGTGTLTLNQTNTYTGGTAVSAGTLQFAKILSMPVTGAVAVGTGTTLAVNVGGNGEWTTGTSGNGTIGGLLAGLGGQSGGTVGYTGNVTLGIDTTNASPTSQTYAGNIANVGTTLALAKLGTNTLVLTTANTYTGGTFVTAGTLQLGGAGTPGASGSNVAVNSGALLDLNGTNQNINFTAGTGVGIVANNSGSGTSTLTLSTAASPAANVIIQDYTTAAGGKVAVVVAANIANPNNSNTYSGGTTVNGGAYLYLQTGSTSNTGAGTGTINLTASNSGLLSDGTGTIANNITGAGYVQNNATGSTNTPVFTGNLTTSGAFIFRNGTTDGFNFGGTGTSSLSGVIGSTYNPVNGSVTTGSITKSNVGTLTLSGANIYSGSTTVTGGTLAGTQTSGTPFGTGLVTVGTGILSLAPSGSSTNVAVTGGTVAAGTLFTFNPDATLSLNKGTQSSLTYTFGGTGTTWTRGTNGTLILSVGAIGNLGNTAGGGGERFLINGTAPTTTGTALLVDAVVAQDRGNNNAGDFVTYGATNGFAAATPDFTNTFTGSTNAKYVSITTPSISTGGAIAAYALKVSGQTLTNTSSLTLGGSATGVAGLILNGGTISGGTSLTTPTSVATELTIYTSGTSVISTPILTATSQAGISVFGPGALDFSSSAGNSFTGGLRINNSTVIANNNNQLGGTTAAITLTGGTLQTSGTVALGGGTRAITLALGQNQPGGTFNVTSGTTTYQNSSTSSNILSGTSLTKTGAGTLVLSGNTTNTYTGGTFVNVGTLQLGASSMLATTGAVTTGGGTFDIQTFSNTVGAVTLAGGSIIGTSGVLTGIAYNVQSGSASANLAGTGAALTKTTSGTVPLNGTNTYTGVTTVSAGTLQFAKQVALYNNNTAGTGWTAANINVASGATLAFNVDSAGTAGFTSTSLNTLLTNISVASSATAGLQSGAILGFDTSTATGGTFTQGNAIANSTGANGGAIGVTKLGTGTLTLNQNNTYSGATTISAGELDVTGSTAAGSAVSVYGTIGGTGTVNGTVHVYSGGTIDAGVGAAVGTLNTGALTIDSGGTFNVHIQTGSPAASNVDKIVVTGTAVLAGTINFTGSANQGLYTVLSATTLTGTFGTASLPSGYRLDYGTLAANTLDLVHLATVGFIADPAYNNINVHPGTQTIGLRVSNTAPTNSDAATYTLAATGVTGLAGNTRNADTGAGYDSNTGTYAAVAGTNTLTVNLTNTGNTWTNTPGSVTVTQTGYRLATAAATLTPVTLTNIHVGRSFATKAVSITNSAANDTFSENLDVLSTTPGTGTSASGTFSGLVAQTANNSSILVGLTGTQSTAGTFGGTVTLNLTSDGTGTSGLGQTANGTSTVAVTGTVYSGLMNWTSSSSGNWNTDGNWTDSTASAVHAAPGLDAGYTHSDTATFGSTSGAVAVHLNGQSPSLAGITFNSSNSYTIDNTGGGTLTLSGGGSGVTITDSSGSHEISAPIVLADNLTGTVTNSGDMLTLSGIISGSGESLTKAGAGTLTLTGSNTYSGGTTVSAGVLKISSANALGTGGLVLAGGSLDSGSSSITLVSTPQTWNNDLVFQGSADLNMGTGAVTLTASRQTTVTGGNLTIGGAISGSTYGLTKAGAGTLTLTGSNTYSGNTIITTGKLALSGAGAINNSPVIKVGAGAYFDVSAVTGGYALASGQTLKGTGTVLGALTVASGSTISPGNSPGMLSQTGDQIWSPGGHYVWEVNQVTGTSNQDGGQKGVNPGFDFINITGALNLGTLSSGSKFNLDITGLTSGATAGNPDGWVATNSYQWTIASASGGITGFSAGEFNLNNLNSIATTGPGFAITQSGTDLVLTYTGGSTAFGITNSSPVVLNVLRNATPGSTATAAINVTNSGTIAGSASFSSLSGPLTAPATTGSIAGSGTGSSNLTIDITGLTYDHTGQTLTVTPNTGASIGTASVTVQYNVGTATADNTGSLAAFGDPLNAVVTGSTSGYVGLSAQSTFISSGSGGTDKGGTATIINSASNSLGSPANVSMAWRTVTSSDIAPLFTNVVELAGLGSDVFVLEMVYSGTHPDAFLGRELLNGSNAPSGLWTNAGTGANRGVYASELTVGNWGTDPTTHEVWAVVQLDATGMTNDFAVIPEPTSLGLLGLGALGLLARRGKRKS